jgi:transposase
MYVKNHEREELDFVKRRRAYSVRFADWIIEQVLESSANSVAKKGYATNEEIETMLKDKAQELIPSKPVGLKRLGIDEIALLKGKDNYCAVLVDLDTSKLIGLLEIRTQEELRETLIGWGTEVLELLEEVSIDLWKGYRSLVEELMPNAQVVADRFHVMKLVNNELDSKRKQEKRQSEKNKNQPEYQEIIDGITGSKYALLKNQ